VAIGVGMGEVHWIRPEICGRVVAELGDIVLHRALVSVKVENVLYLRRILGQTRLYSSHF